jgi:hypothetical protein
MTESSANSKKIAKQWVGLPCFGGVLHIGKRAKLLLAKPDRGIFFVSAFWFLFVVCAYTVLIPFSYVRDFSGRLTPLAYYLIVLGFCLFAFNSGVTSFRRLPRKCAVCFFCSATVVMASYVTMNVLADCFECSLAASVRILTSNKCNNQEKNFDVDCVVYSTSYRDGDYSIVRLSNPQLVSDVSAGRIQMVGDRQQYILFERYLVSRVMVPYYLGPFGPGKF